MKKGFGAFLSANLPFIVIGGVFLWSVFEIASRRSGEVFTDKITIRIGHWQLEPGVREGLDEAAVAYQKLHPEVRIVQEAIPESTYGQWLSTQLMGRTAPDIVQIGQLPLSQLTAYYARYMVPVTPYVSQPNPYNKGTDLEGVPLIKTFKDGMRRSYIVELQEFMNIPLGLASMRLFYNKSLLRELTGKEEVTGGYRGFLKICEEIQQKKHPNGRPYIPIAGSSYHFNGWMANVILPMTHDVFYETDFNHDGLFSKDEQFVGFLSGRINFDDPSFRGSFKMVKEITQYFPHGWTGLNRDEAIFNFAQQKAVFLSTGLWEAEGIWQQAKGKFEIGVMDFPLPGPDDPEYGHIIRGHRYENPEGGMSMAITNTSKHQAAALDFLFFLASQKQNESFNHRLKWIPIINGAKVAPELQIFEPRVEGVFPAWEISIGPESFIKWEQMFSLYQIGQISYDDMAKEYANFYTTIGKDDCREFNRNLIRGQIQRAQFAVGLREIALANDAPTIGTDWIKYRTALTPLLTTDTSTLKLNGYLEDPKQAKEELLFSYSPTALENIRKAAKEKVK